MNKFSEKIIKNKNLILMVSSIFLVLSFIGYKLTKVNYDILVYLPEDIETIKGQNILTNDFDMGSYSIVLVSDMSSKDILELENKISNVDGVNKVMSIYDVFGNNIPVDILPSEVRSHIHDDNTDLLFVTYEGGTSSTKTIDAVREIRSISDKTKVGGMSSMVLDTMNLSDKEITIYVLIAVILCLLVLELTLDSYLVPVLLLLNIGVSIIFNLGTNLMFGEISYITESLVVVLQLGVTTDYSIFLYHSYEKKKNKMSKEEAMKEAIKETFTSVIGSSLTTIAGFLVLISMKLTLGKDLGLVMAKGVLLGVVTVLTVFPSLLLVFDKYIEKTKHKSINLKFSKLNNFVVKNHVVIFILFLLILIPAYLANKNVSVYYKMDESLPKTLESISSNTELKDKFNIVSPEIILLSNDMTTDSINSMTKELKSVEGIDFVLSMEELKSLGVSEDMIPSELMSTLKNDKYELMLVNSIYEVASDELNNQIDKVNEIVKRYNENSIVAGEGPLMKDLVEISDTDFNNVNGISIICILIIICVVLKSLSLPILLITAIETAIFINMGISYFGNVTLPFVAPIVLGTIQLGATIDYAILLTTSYLNNRCEGLDKKESMVKTLNYNAASIFISGLCFFAATFGVGLYSKIDMVGSLCTLISRGAIISMAITILVLPSILLIFDKLIMKTTKKKGDKMKNKKLKLAIGLVTLLIVNPINTYALTKNETVYAKVSYDGKVSSINVNEHIINNEKLTLINDYSELDDIFNLNGNEKYSKDGNFLTWNTTGNDIFYQGKLKNSLPIEMNITYLLDGESIDLKDLLGKSGNVTIRIKYTNNDSHLVNVNSKYENLYTPFVVTMGTIINNENNSNITVSNGKVLSSGTKSVVMGVSMPGLYESLNMSDLKNLNTIEINYDTTNFELSTMYSVVSSNLISSDTNIFNKLNSLTSKVDELESNMNTIDESASMIKDGSNKIKSGLKSSIDELSNNNSSALSDSQKEMIKANVLNTVNSQFTDEKNLEISDTAEKLIEEELKKGNPEINELVANEIQNSFTEFLTNANLMNDYTACMTAKKMGKDENTMTIDELTSCDKLNNANVSLVLDTLTKSNSSIASKVSEKVAIKTAREVSVISTMNASTETASMVTDSILNTLPDTIKNEAIKEFTQSLNVLYTNIDTLDNGINELSSGITKYNNEGIKVIGNLVNNQVNPMVTRLNKLIELGENYNTVSSENLSKDSETKFILVVDGEKKETKETEVKKEETKKTFWELVKGLFK